MLIQAAVNDTLTLLWSPPRLEGARVGADTGAATLFGGGVTAVKGDAAGDPVATADTDGDRDNSSVLRGLDNSAEAIVSLYSFE